MQSDQDVTKDIFSVSNIKGKQESMDIIKYAEEKNYIDKIGPTSTNEKGGTLGTLPYLNSSLSSIVGQIQSFERPPRKKVFGIM